MDVAYVLNICYNSMFQKFYQFHSSVAASIFMLQVASVLSRCCIYFYTYVASVSSRCFICFRCMLRSSVFTLHVFDVVRRV